LGWGQPGFSDLGTCEIRQACQDWSPPPRARNYGHFTPLAQMLIKRQRRRILWGTNWPHRNAVDGRHREK